MCYMAPILANHSVVSNLLSASEIENHIHKLWELDQFYILPYDTTLSITDKHALSFWERNSKTDDANIPILIPWENSYVSYSNNQAG